MNTQEARTPLRYLVLGSTGYGGVESVDWLEGELPNLIDYDLIVVDVPSLNLDRLAASGDLKRFERIKAQLVKFLDSQGTLIVITSATISHKRPKRYPEVITNYVWSPIEILTQLEKGKSIITKQAEFKTYLSLLSDWDYLFFIPSDCLSRELTDFYGPTHRTKFKIPCKPILENRYGRALAERCHIEIYYERTKPSFSGPYTEYPEKPDRLTGEIILLPRIPGLDNRKAVSLVLQEITGLPQQTLSPEWADKLIVPGIPGLLAQVHEKRKQIQALETEITKLNEKVDSLNEYKRLLYGTGSELEKIVERCFIELGGQVPPAKYSQEEFVLMHRGAEYLVEVKGTSKSIALDHLRQLNDYLLRYQEVTGQICKGILFGNAWCTLPPQDRDKRKTLVFPDNVKKRAKQWDVALISSIEFYQAFIGFLEHGKGDSLLDAVTTQRGIIKLPYAKEK